MLTSPEVLSLRALNRSLLDRQMLLRRATLPAAGTRAERVIETIEHLAGLQAQAPFPPYYGLWSRLEGFRPEDLAKLILDRGVSVLGKQLTGVDTGALAAAGRDLVEERPRTFSELGALLSQRWPGYPAAALAQTIRAMVPLVQVPPRAVWGAAGQAAHTSAESWLGRPMDASPRLEQLVTRYLAAFGPATVRDIQAWSGLTRLGEITDRLRPALRTFRDERGSELFDLPDAPRPGPDTPAPVRLVAEFDNLILSHADRTRVISEQNRMRLFTKNGIFPGTVLVNGFAAGIWRLDRSKAAAVLTIELFDPVSRRDRDAVTSEAERMLGFAVPDVPAHQIHFVPAR